MTTSLSTAGEILSKELGDFWSSTTTAAGTATTLVDTALKAKANAWIDGDREMYVIIRESTYNGLERKI